MTTLREKNNTSDHHRAWQAFFQKMKNLHVLFSFEQQGFTKKKLTERQTHLHKNIIILLVLIKNILKKCVNKNDFIDCSEKQNWKKAKIKNKEKKKIIIMKMRVFLILCAPLLCVLPIIKKKTSNFVNQPQDLKKHTL